MATKAKPTPVPVETNGDGVQIAELMITDFLAIKFLKIDKPGHLVIISGDNATGKTSTLRAIEELFKPSGVGVEVIHDDSEKAELYVRLTNGIEAKRIRTRKSERLDLRQGDEPIAKPQTFLDELVGNGPWFDVLQFALAKPRDRREMLLAAIDVRLAPEWLYQALGEHASYIHFEDDEGTARFDWSKHGLVLLAEIRQHVYDRRAEVNRDVTRLAKAIEQDRQDIPDTVDAEQWKDFDPKATRAAHEAALGRVAEAEAAVKENAAKKGKVDLLKERNKQLVVAGEKAETAISIEVTRHEEAIRAENERHEQEMARIHKEIDSLKAEREKLVIEGVALRAEVDAFVPPDVAALRAEATALSERLNEFDQFVEIGGQLKQIQRREIELAEAQDHHRCLDETHRLLVDTVPIALMKSIDMPIDGLTIGDEDVRINGRTMENLSDGERMEAAMEIAAFLQRDRKLKIILVNGVERIVGAMWERFQATAKRLAKEHGIQFWITRTEPHDFEIKKEHCG